MNRARIIALALIVSLAIGGYSAFSYVHSFKKVTFSLSKKATGVVVYTAGTDSDAPQKIGSPNADGVLSLRKGEYYAVPTGNHVDTSQITFSVSDKPLFVAVSPGYSQDYLSQHLNSQLPAINQVITNRYTNVINNFTINSGKLYDLGDWYGTTLTQAPAYPGANSELYRVVLHLQQGSWHLATTPQLALSARDYPDIPVAVLRDVNSQQAVGQ